MRLTARQEQAVCFHCEQGMGYAQIADAMSIGLQSVKNHIWKAVRRSAAHNPAHLCYLRGRKTMLEDLVGSRRRSLASELGGVADVLPAECDRPMRNRTGGDVLTATRR